jgi:hypothetical protein
MLIKIYVRERVDDAKNTIKYFGVLGCFFHETVWFIITAIDY